MREQTLAVQRMQDYIEKNVTQEIHLADLAQASLFTPWYSYRLFREVLGLTPTEYVRRLRLSQAAVRLREGKERVIDVAFDLGFPMWIPSPGRFSGRSASTPASI